MRTGQPVSIMPSSSRWLRPPRSGTADRMGAPGRRPTAAARSPCPDLPLHLRRQTLHISSSVKSTAGATRTRPRRRALPPLPPRQFARQQERDPAAHGRADGDLRPAQQARTPRGSPRASGRWSVRNWPRIRRARKVEARTMARPFSPPRGRAPRPWCPSYPDLKPPSPRQAREPAPSRARTAIRRAAGSSSSRREFQARIVHAGASAIHETSHRTPGKCRVWPHAAGNASGPSQAHPGGSDRDALQIPCVCACPYRKSGSHFSGTCARTRPGEGNRAHVSNDYGERQLSPRTLAGATVCRSCRAARGPVACTAVDVASPCCNTAPRALVGPMTVRWSPSSRRSGANGFRSSTPRSTRSSCERTHHPRGADRPRADRHHPRPWASAAPGAPRWRRRRLAVWLVTTLPDVPSVSGAAGVLGGLARARPGDRYISFAASL